MGEGLTKLLKKISGFDGSEPRTIPPRLDEAIYRLLYRTVTRSKFQEGLMLADWYELMEVYFLLPHGKEVEVRSKVNELKAYINGSFAMNTLPERRRSALEMVDVLIEVQPGLTKLEIG